MIDTQLEYVQHDLTELVNMFGDAENFNIKHLFSEKPDRVVNTIVINGKAFAYGNLLPTIKDDTDKKRLYKRYAKLSLYKALSRFLGKDLPWGALTGVRPTKLAYQQLEKDGEFENFFLDTMKVSVEKTSLIKDVLTTQKSIYTLDENNSDLFVFIPFCPTRCKYCSFITADVKSSKKYVEDYVDALVYEIENSKQFIKNLRTSARIMKR